MSWINLGERLSASELKRKASKAKSRGTTGGSKKRASTDLDMAKNGLTKKKTNVQKGRVVLPTSIFYGFRQVNKIEPYRSMQTIHIICQQLIKGSHLNAALPITNKKREN
ncbi:hypothetical protein Fot_57998 [Forsythia ovata]|uniref:Uncharacterized protein n=1 Tax=Forsythia ovata TaxID=205694 RepID=A0ABD1NTS0_9LAMI